MKNKITLIVKTFERPLCINKLIYSVKMVHPDIRIIVADDSRKYNKIYGVDHLKMPYDSGASAGRNLALSKVDTQYVVTLDDDFVFNKYTNLIKWMQILDETSLDIIGGNVQGHPNYHSTMEINNKALIFNSISNKQQDGFNLWDIVLQFWMGKTEKIKSIGGWDNDFKTVDHIIFFARSIGRIKIAYCQDVSVGHMPVVDCDYYQHRNGRMQKYLRLLMDKLNVEKVIDVNGNILYTYDGNAVR